MPFDQWIAFAAATAVLLAIPGPTVLLVIAYALTYGRKAAFATVAGVGLGDLVAITASLAGLGVLLATSAELFTLLRWVGAAYLVWLGIKLWRTPVAALPGEAAEEPPLRRRKLFLHAFVVTALNPKGIVFFVAFLPQFVDPAAPLLPQFAILEATFVGFGIVNALAYALLASAARRTIRRPRVQRAVNRTGGGLLVGAGVLTAAWRKAG